MNKKIDVSVLPDGFLIEVPSRGISGAHTWSIKRMNSLARTYAGFGDYRPALDIWHFNNGLMVLPDGLVVETMEYHCDKPDRAIIADGKVLFLALMGIDRGWNDCDRSDLSDMCAFKILGVTAEYEIGGKRLGLEVIEL